MIRQMGLVADERIALVQGVVARRRRPARVGVRQRTDEIVVDLYLGHEFKDNRRESGSRGVKESGR